MCAAHNVVIKNMRYNEFMTTLFQYMKAHKILVAAIIISLCVGGYYLTRPAAVPGYETAKVERGDVVQEVSVTGRVNSEAEVNLAFEKSGRVVSLPLPVGTKVGKGDILVRLDASELAALRSGAAANVDYELANLAQLKKGSRGEDIAVSEAAVVSAETTLADARKSLFDKIGGAHTSVDDVLHSTIDQFFRNPRSHNPEFTPPASNAGSVATLQTNRIILEEKLTSWGVKVSILGQNSSVDESINDANEMLGMMRDYLDLLALVISGIQSSSLTPQTTIDGWKLAVSTARASINSATSATLSGAQTYRSALASLNVAKEQLALKKAGATPESIAAQEARVAGVRATLENYDTQIAKSILRAPFGGVITKQDAKIGQTVSPNVPIVSVMSDGKFQIEANIPEVDVAKIAVGDSARVTLDAYGADVVFAATVSAIDPAETVLEGVSTYKVTLQFDKTDARVRSGMTANIDISTDKREGVLYIPLRAVTTKEGKKFVRVQNGTNLTETEVVLGLRGSSGTIEVLKGLELGQSVVTFTAK